MGIQSSVFFCRTKNQCKRICKAFNLVREEVDENVIVALIGRNKTELDVSHFFYGVQYTIPANWYFVWIEGERHPYQDYEWLDNNIFSHFSREHILYEYVENIIGFVDLIFDFNRDLCGVVQNTEYIDLIELPYGEEIDISVIDLLDLPGQKVEK